MQLAVDTTLPVLATAGALPLYVSVYFVFKYAACISATVQGWLAAQAFCASLLVCFSMMRHFTTTSLQTPPSPNACNVGRRVHSLHGRNRLPVFVCDAY